MTASHNIVLEFTRAREADRPHAFEFAPQTYILHKAGGGVEQAMFPWSEALLDVLADVRRPGRAADVPHVLGDTLREFLGGTGWNLHEDRIHGARRVGAPIHVSIRSNAAELYVLPWELVALRPGGHLLGALPGLLVRYEWPGTETFPDNIEPRTRRGRVLFAWSAAGGAVPAAEHQNALRAALGDAFQPERDVVPHATFDALHRALLAAERGPPVDALHILCHGAPTGNTYGLVLDDRVARGPMVVDAGRVQQLIDPHAGMLRLVVLAACDSGNSGVPGSHLGSVAQRIHRAGIQAVVGSRFPITAEGSVSFAESFYSSLARDRASLETAFLAARDALAFDHPRELDWASVQLYCRAADGDRTFPIRLPEPGARSEPRRPPSLPPPSPRDQGATRTHSRIELVLDRIEQWGVVLERCANEDRHLAFIVHGDRRQNVVLFAERIQRFLDRECLKRHAIVRIDRRAGGSLAVTAGDWEAITIQATDAGRGTLESALRQEARRTAVALLYLDGNQPLHDLDADSAQGLADFLRSRLPGALALAAAKNPIRVILPLEHDPGLADQLHRALSQKTAARHITVHRLTELKFPPWSEVDRTLRDEFDELNDEVLDESQRCYDAVATAQQDVRALAKGLREILLRWEDEHG